jgi:hypothetical protein
MISAKTEGFNQGQTYCFVARKQQHPYLKSGVGLITKDMFDGADLIALSEKLAKLASRYHTEFVRRNMFIGLQRRLKTVWNSIPFNLAVLTLIVSNFVFTVQQMENDDPARQPCFDRLDLSCTVLFIIGACCVLRFLHMTLLPN